MTTYQITRIDFLTQMPENNFQGDPKRNNELINEWQGTTIRCDHEYPSEHLEIILNYIEDTCGMLVGNVDLKCLGKRNRKTPNSFVEEMPSLSGRYPAGWVWVRTANLVN